jgi:hypothetical protein
MFGRNVIGGFLQVSKRGHFFTSWRRRWLVVSGAKVTYYVDAGLEDYGGANPALAAAAAEEAREEEERAAAAAAAAAAAEEVSFWGSALVLLRGCTQISHATTGKTHCPRFDSSTNS